MVGPSSVPPQASRLFVALQSEFIARVFPPRTEANRHALPAVVVAVVTTPKPPLSHSVSPPSVSLRRLSFFPPSTPSLLLMSHSDFTGLHVAAGVNIYAQNNIFQ